MTEFLRGPLSKYDPEGLANKVLADDLRILAAWAATGVLPRDHAARLMAKILKVVASRKRKGKMNWTLRLGKVKDSSLWLLALSHLEKDDILTLLEVDKSK